MQVWVKVADDVIRQRAHERQLIAAPHGRQLECPEAHKGGGHAAYNCPGLIRRIPAAQARLLGSASCCSAVRVQAGRANSRSKRTKRGDTQHTTALGSYAALPLQRSASGASLLAWLGHIHTIHTPSPLNMSGNWS